MCGFNFVCFPAVETVYTIADPADYDNDKPTEDQIGELTKDAGATLASFDDQPRASGQSYIGRLHAYLAYRSAHISPLSSRYSRSAGSHLPCCRRTFLSETMTHGQHLLIGQKSTPTRA